MLKTGLLIFLMSLTGLYYAYQVMPGCLADTTHCYDLHYDILNHSAPAPYRYRILATALANLFAQNQSEASLVRAYMVFHSLCFGALFSGLYVWLTKWVDETKALVGVLLVAAVFPLAFRHYFLSPWAALEIALLCWGLVCLSFMPRSLSLPA